MNRTTSKLVRLGALVALVGAVAACGSDSDSESSSSGPAAASGASTVEITDAWARTSPSMTNAGAAYVTLMSSKDDALTAVEVDATIAKSVELHETTMEGSDTSMAMGSDTTMAMGSDTTAAMGSDESAPAAMSMQPVDKIDLPAGETVKLEPGGYHIMLIDLAKPLVSGDTFTAELVFEKAGTQSVTFTVRDDAP